MSPKLLNCTVAREEIKYQKAYYIYYNGKFTKINITFTSKNRPSSFLNEFLFGVYEVPIGVKNYAEIGVF